MLNINVKSKWKMFWVKLNNNKPLQENGFHWHVDSWTLEDSLSWINVWDFGWLILKKKYHPRYNLCFTLLKSVLTRSFWQKSKMFTSYSVTVITNAILKLVAQEHGSALYRRHTVGGRAFGVDAPTLWNSPLSDICIASKHGHIQISPEKLPVK